MHKSKNVKRQTIRCLCQDLSHLQDYMNRRYTDKRDRVNEKLIEESH
jgi:hypothetical protein